MFNIWVPLLGMVATVQEAIELAQEIRRNKCVGEVMYKAYRMQNGMLRVKMVVGMCFFRKSLLGGGYFRDGIAVLLFGRYASWGYGTGAGKDGCHVSVG